MEWAEPAAFYLLWLIPAWIGLQVYARSRRRRAAAAFLDPAAHAKLLPQASAARFWTRTALGSLALLFAILAVARPRFGSYVEQVKRRGSDLVVLLDVSRSMLATDVTPNRLERAKGDIKLLLQRLKGERVALVAFAGKPVIKCPLTADHGFFRLALDDLDTNSAPRGGTLIGDALRKGLELLPADTQRDQAMLLITDGEDQNSYPLEAAAACADRKVIVFTLGLGDPDQGARVPGREAGSFLTHEGQQVWTKMDPTLLRQLAVRTRGASILAGTRSYDLGQLYEDHLAHLRGEEITSEKRQRLHERYQWFLALALLCFCAELLIAPYPPRHARAREQAAVPVAAVRKRAKAAAALIWLGIVTNAAGFAGEAKSPEPPAEPEPVQAGPPALDENEAYARNEEGLQFYAAGAFADARQRFEQARAGLQDASVVEFNLGCVAHKLEERDEAERMYSTASLAQDRRLAVQARFNMGTLDCDAARKLVGADPEQVESAKREEILKALESAVRHYRACLNLDRGYQPARKNLELLRQWIKYWTGRWKELDRQKRREQLDLVRFLEYLVAAQQKFRGATEELAAQERAPADAWAELKRVESELIEEIPFLRKKIEQAAGTEAGDPQAADPKALEAQKQALEALLKAGDEAGQAMERAEARLAARDGAAALDDQRVAIEKLDFIWEIVVPFQRLLGHDFKGQTEIVKHLEPTRITQEAAHVPLPLRAPDASKETKRLAEAQEKIARRTALLVPKAKQELEQLKNEPPPEHPAPPPEPGQPAPPTPEQIKQGLEKAIELAPGAVASQLSALKHLQAEWRLDAYPEAEAARKILEEIVKAQPPQPPDPQQNQDSQDQQEQQQEEPEPKPQENKTGADGKTPESKSEDQQDKPEDGEKKEPKLTLSPEQIDALLRRVREREQERRRKLDEIQGRLLGPADVDKDW
ncbi:MAG: hypothetical protein AMXMBFR7_08050 [Planctomycetota bacterium]